MTRRTRRAIVSLLLLAFAISLVPVVAAPEHAPAATARDDAVVVRGATWYLRRPSGGTATSFVYGRSGDVALMGDWNGDGVTTPGVVRGNTWYLRNRRSAGPPDLTFVYGRVGDVPVVGDWNRDGVDTPGVVRGTTWYLRNRNSAGSAHVTLSYGTRGDVPVAGDWNGDGRTTVGVVRRDRWLLRNALTAGAPHLDFRYGGAGDAPVVGDWDGNGTTTVGMVQAGTWRLRNRNSAGTPQVTFTYGRCGDAPLGTSSARTTPSVPVTLRGTEWSTLPTTKRVVALTFDGGASADGAASILATLERTQTPATFFFTGDFVQRYPAVARQAAARHPIGNHTQTHPDLTTISRAAAADEIIRAHWSIRTITGVEPRPFFRFPFGARNAATIAQANCLSYGSVRWTVDTLGWKGTTGGQSTRTVVNRVLANLKPGAIVLLHVGAHPKDRSTLDADALPRIISEVRARGYSFVSLNAYR